MITIQKQTNDIHTTGGDNWWVFNSDLDYAPRFSLRANVFSDNTLLNSLLLPTNPDGVSTINMASILPDFVEPDPQPSIDEPTVGNQFIEYNIELSESFEGLFIETLATANKVSGIDVLNNFTLLDLPIPLDIKDIQFTAGPVVTPIDDIYIINFATNSNGFVNFIEVSQSPTSSVPIDVLITSSKGFLQLNDISFYSIGETQSTSTKSAILANPDYLFWDEDEDVSGYLPGTAESKFLTRKRYYEIGIGEYLTLSYINEIIPDRVRIEGPGVDIDFSDLPSDSDGRIVNIPVGDKNLEIGPEVPFWTVSLLDQFGSKMSEDFVIKRVSKPKRCGAGVKFTSGLRLMWLNSVGGWDYWTFNFTEEKTRVIERESFNKNKTWKSGKFSRGETDYKIKDYTQWTLSSGPVDDKTADWIVDLFTSKSVWLIDGDADVIPVVVTDDSYVQSFGFEDVEVKPVIRLSRANIK